MANLHKYQEETRAWRDSKVKLHELDVGDLVLLQNPCTKSSEKLESKSVGTYVAAEKPRSGAYCLLDFQDRMLEHSCNMETSIIFFI
jgi:hypothetical protein